MQRAGDSSIPIAAPRAAPVGSTGRDDRIYRETRWLAAFIIPWLVVAFLILFLFPNNTEQLFAWTIRPTMTPMLMGSGYLAGAYFFHCVLRAKKWHQVALGFPPVATFASFMTVATVLHLDKFNFGHVSFWAWALLYATTPFLVVATWLRNRRTDPGTPEPGEKLVPLPVRLIVGVAGAINLITAILLLLFPNFMIDIWPWQLTPLTARVIGGWFALPGVVGLMVASDPRWSSARAILQSQIFGIVLILASVVRAWSEFNPANPLTWGFVGGITALLLLVLSLYIGMELRGRSTERAAAY